MSSLHAGLKFEDCNAVLPWGCQQATAWTIGRPSHTNNQTGDFSRLTWHHKVLGGLDCIACCYIPEDGALDSISLSLNLPETFHIDRASYSYMKFFDHFLTLFGPPAMEPARGTLFAPILTWQQDGCILQVYTGERFGHFTTCEITHSMKGRF